MSKKMFVLTLAVVAVCFLVSPGWGEDLDIYGNTVAGVKPNCLIIFDTSGSMARDDVPVNPYDYTVTYDCGSGDCFDPNKWYYWGEYVVSTSEECVDVCTEEQRVCVKQFWWGGCKKWETNCITWGEDCQTYENIEMRWIAGGDISDIECDEIKTALNETGTYTQSWCNPEDSSTGGPTCTNDNRGCDSGYARETVDIYSGNYRNYEMAAAASTTTDLDADPDNDGFMTRTYAAKKVVKEVIEANSDTVNFGLMRLSETNNGGQMVMDCGATKEELITAVESLPANGYTPLAESLAEAGRYFAGLGSWYGISYSSGDWWSNGKYTSPIEYRCQNNYVVVMTDGIPTKDGLNIRYSNVVSGTYDDYGIEYINGEKIGGDDGDGDADNDGNEDSIENPGDSDMSCYDAIDDVAWFLNRVDLNSTLEGIQNLQVSTIGFGADTAGQAAVTLLTDAADNGGGFYFQASTSTGLKNAFSTIVGSMVEETSIFVAPVVPVNRVKRSADSELIYLAFFKPQSSGAWIGNIKKYNLCTEDNYLDHNLTKDDIGNIYDREWKSAVSIDGTVASNALDYWAVDTSGNTGAIDKGGVGEQLNRRTTARALYTYIDSYYDTENSTLVALADNKLLTSAYNSFSTSNTYLLEAPHNLTTARITAVHGTGAAWKLGDIVHAEPVVVHYSDKTVIFAGSNDAVFHCFDDNTGGELWGFVPPDQFGRLDLISATDNYAFIDGGITVTYDDLREGDIISTIMAPRTVIFGERRGGTSFFALDVSDYAAPEYLYQIDEDYLKTYAASQDSYEKLGQSWVRPVSAKVSAGVDSDTGNAIKKDAFVLTGGYDTDQDNDQVDGYTDDTGRAVFIVDELTGSLIFGLGNMQAASSANFQYKSDMKYCVTDVLATIGDFNYGENAGITNRLYFGDLGANVFAVADDISSVTKDDDGNITIHKQLANGAWPTFKQVFAGSDGRKILYAPAVGSMCSKELVMFGTGDRTDPNDTSVTNRFYCVVNEWYGTDPATDSDLMDISSAVDWTEVSKPQGWYFQFSHTGEKVVSAPTFYNGQIIFTTYTPASGTASDDTSDPCGFSGARGQGRVYTIETKCSSDGDLIVKVKDPDGDPTSAENPLPQYTIVDGKLLTGLESKDLPEYMTTDYFYWRQQQ